MANTCSEERISFLDHIRGIAILLVLAFHALEPAFGMNTVPFQGWWRDFGSVPKSILPLLPLSFGWAGVAIFFVVSGFCVHLSHQRSKHKELKVFFIRRIFRIVPPYTLALCLFAFVVPLSRLHGEHAENVRQFVSHLFLVHNFHEDLAYGINGPFWSIATEFQLYLLYPLLLVAVRRWGWNGALWVTAAIEIGLRTVDLFPQFPGNPVLLRAHPIFYWFSWSIGAKLADDWLHGRPLFLQSVPVWLFPSLMAVSLFFKPLFTYCFLFIALSTARWMVAWMSPSSAAPARPRPGSELLRLIGVISFSIYLLHQPFLHLVPDGLRMIFPRHYFHPMFIYAISLGVGAAVCVASWFFYRWVELPSIAAGKWLVGKIARPASPPLVTSPTP